MTINLRTGLPFPTGARPSPAHRLFSADWHAVVRAPPQQVAYIPKQLDVWGNDRYGDCVTAEEAFAKACYLPEIFIPEAEVIRWARAHGVLNGASLVEVLDGMEEKGFVAGPQLYNDGRASVVEFSNQTILHSAISDGPVKIAIAAGALPSGAGNHQGWWDTGDPRNRRTDHCFTGDTKVSLLDGRELSFAELAAGAAGDSFWVYSCDEKGNIVRGHAHSVRKTRTSADLVKVTLDNGESIRCTLDHRFLMRDGTYKEAQRLQAEDSLMPLYRSVSKGGYELCWNPRHKGKKGWRATHRIVAFGANGRSGGMAAHHIDFSKRNNSPENLRVMMQSEHAALHAQFSRKNKTPEHRAMARDLMKALWNDPAWAEKQRAKLAASASARGRRTGELGKSGFHTMSAEVRRRNGLAAKGRRRSMEAIAKGAASRRKRLAEDPEFRESARLAALKASRAAALKPITEKQRAARRENARKLNARMACANNHKVVSVEPCGREDVYDLTVDEHHNFALTAGVFVHNCVALTGYGQAGYLYQQLEVALPAGLPGDTFGYLLFTWGTIGFVDYRWILGTTDEAWVRHPTTIGVPPLTPPVPPAPPVPPIPPEPQPPTDIVEVYIAGHVMPGRYILFPKSDV